MFDFHKRIFANKREMPYAKPMCPYLTNSSGFASLRRTNAPHADVRQSARLKSPLYIVNISR